MKLKIAVWLAGTSAILVFFGVAEVLTYRQAAEFFAHQPLLPPGPETEAAVAAFRQETALLRLLSAAGAIAAFSTALNLLWRRFLSRPVDLLRDRINAMSRGTWTQPVALQQDDEIGRLIRDFNLLGPRLTFTAHQFAAASKLAAMALIGQRVARRTTLARSRLAEIQESLSAARCGSHAVPQSALHQIAKVAEELTHLAQDLESGFNEELTRQGLPPKPAPGREEPLPRASAGPDRFDRRIA